MDALAPRKNSVPVFRIEMGILITSGVLLAIGVIYAVYKPAYDASDYEDDSGDNSGDDSTTMPVAVSNSYAQPMTSFDQRVIDFSNAIARAEGFGVKNAIPTKYHNPGDLKPPTGAANYWAGQSGVGDGGHAIFNTDNDGWNALRKQIRLWATNKSNVAGTSTSFLTLSQSYAENWQPWINNVLAYLQAQGYQVNQNSSLGDFFNG